jgi:RimJ/RimL family protein N-acetyltransferase
MLDKIVTRVRSRGPGEVAHLLRSRAREAIASSDTLILLVRATGGASPPDRTDVVVRRTSAEDGERYARDIGTDSPRSFRARLSPVTCCYVVESGGRFLHASWMTTSGAWTRELRRLLRPPVGDGYVYESFTRAEARGRGLYPHTLEAICRDAAARGLHRMWVAVDAGNPSSLRAVAKAGFEEAGRVGFRRRWGRVTVEVRLAEGEDAFVRLDTR